MDGWFVCTHMCMCVCIQMFLRFFLSMSSEQYKKMPNAIILVHQNLNFKKITSRLMDLCVYVSLCMHTNVSKDFSQVCHWNSIRMPNAIIHAHQNLNVRKITSRLMETTNPVIL